MTNIMKPVRLVQFPAVVLLGLLMTHSGQRCWQCDHPDFAQSTATSCRDEIGQFGTAIDCPTPSSEFLKNVCRIVKKGNEVFKRDCRMISSDDSSGCTYTESGVVFPCSYCDKDLCNENSTIVTRIQDPVISLRCWFCDDFAQSSEFACRNGIGQFGTVIDCPNPQSSQKNVCITSKRGDHVYRRGCVTINRTDSKGYKNSFDKLGLQYCDKDLCNGSSSVASKLQLPIFSLLLLFESFYFVH